MGGGVVVVGRGGGVGGGGGAWGGVALGLGGLHSVVVMGVGRA